MEKIKIDILPNYFLNDDGTFKQEEAIMLSGKIAGVCYDKEGFNHLLNEDESKTKRRIDMTLNNGHHSVYDHIMISLNLQNIPKILSMVINNENQYTTSEKSLRYTPITSGLGGITVDEEKLYNKWMEIFKIRIKNSYGDIYADTKIKKLAQENARYLVSVFIPTQMIYTTSLRQINYIASFMKKYIENIDKDNNFEVKLACAMNDFINELNNKNLLVDGLMKNEKSRELSLFGRNLDNCEEYFGDVYCTSYKGSFAELAQAQRHRTLNYQMEFLSDKEYFVPPIILDDKNLVNEWLNDIKSVSDVVPQGELVKVVETGNYNNFILKCMERLCSAAQLEIMLQTRDTLLKYKSELESKNHPLALDIKKYSNGARCTFPCFTCTENCNFKEGKTLRRKI